MADDRALARQIHNVIEREFDGDAIATNLVKAARHAGLRLSLACGLIEQESGFKNVFGHDPTIFVGAGRVTRAKYRRYKRARGHTRMQGVGPAQLTFWSYQDEADKLGGCWSSYPNMLVGFRALAANIHAHGEELGIAIYNGGQGNPNHTYSREVRAKAKVWHDRLT